MKHNMRQTLPKLCGADVELGNFILGVEHRDGTGAEASRALLREIDGVPHVPSYQYGSTSTGAAVWPAATAYDPQDWGRKFLAANGGCVYIDLDHLEVCLPEVLSAFDYVAAWHAMLRIARRAQEAANAKQPAGQSIQVLANNSDGRSHSYGGHLNLLITRRAWDNIFNRRLHYLVYLASLQASSIVITGQGKVGSENGAPVAAYQLSQRADFFETLVGLQTTHNRPLVNSRDEALCGGVGASGPASAMARLHCIFFDSTLCHVATLLKVGMMQLALAMIEAEHVNPRLTLQDPVDAVQRWSHDPTLRARAPLVSGPSVTAVELQLLFLEEARRFADAGGCRGIVPQAEEMLQLWEGTLQRLKVGDFEALAARLDWALKLQILRRARARRPGLRWESPELKHLDHLYSSLDPHQGLYWAYEASGAVERVVDASRVDDFVHTPPADTRAWARAMLLRRAARDEVVAVDWDGMLFRDRWADYPPAYRRLELADPLAFNQTAVAAAFENGAQLDAILDTLDASHVRPGLDATSQLHANGDGFIRAIRWN